MGPEALDYYKVLEIEPTASQEDIYNAYQRAHQTFSLQNPNIYKIFTPEEASAWVTLIDEAYTIIGSPNKRRVYDQERGYIRGELPSFELSESSTQNENTSSQDATPPVDQGRTKVSQYHINAKMEEAIAKQDVFDGLFLKKIREYKNIDLTEFSNVTCIAIRHLYAIENNNFSVLPAAVFVRGYIIQYCRVLNLDERKVVSSFMALMSNDN